MKVTITDYTHYASDSCCNGGNYSFTVTYRQIDDDNFEVLHSTSSEYPYCPLCGNFYQGNCPCGMEEPEIRTWEQVKTEVENAHNRATYGDEDITISYC